MEEFPSSKAHELETDFDSLMPMMSCEGDNGELGGNAPGGSDDESEYSDSEDEADQNPSNNQYNNQHMIRNPNQNNQSNRSNLNSVDISEVFGPNVDLLWAKKRKGNIVSPP